MKKQAISLRAQSHALRTRFARFAGLAMSALLLAATPARARLSTPYEHRGTIESVDYSAHLVVLSPEPPPKWHPGQIIKPTTFAWDEHTRFVLGGQSTNVTALSHGNFVHLYYEYHSTKEPPVLRKVLWEKD